MLATLNDPFTRFLEPEKFKSLRVCCFVFNFLVYLSLLYFFWSETISFVYHVNHQCLDNYLGIAFSTLLDSVQVFSLNLPISSLKAVWNPRCCYRCWAVDWLPYKIWWIPSRACCNFSCSRRSCKKSWCFVWRYYSGNWLYKYRNNGYIWCSREVAVSFLPLAVA